MQRASLQETQSTPTSHSGAGTKKVLIPQGVLPRLWQFAQVTFQPGEIAREHTHDDFYEVMLVEKGKGMIKVNGTEYPFNEGTSVAVEPGELHEVINNGNEPLIITFFSIFTL